MIKHFTLAFFLFLVMGQIKSQTLGFVIEDGRKKVDIPFERHNNLIIIPVILNNAIPLKFVVDTGVRTAILTDRFISDVLNISYDREINLIGAGGGESVKAFIAHNVSLTLPGVRGSGQAILVLEEDYLNLSQSLGVDVHGILGYEIFSRFVVKINYHTGIMTLYEPFEFKAPKKYVAIDLLAEDTKPYIFTPLVINDSLSLNAKLMVDTGASHSLLLDATTSDKIVVPEAHIKGKLGRGLSGDIMGAIGRVNRIKLNEFEFKRVITTFPEPEGYKDIIQNTGRNGTIGGGLLSRFHVIFDYFNGKIYLKKNRKFREPFEYNMSGIDFDASGDFLNVYVVNYVRANSNAEKEDVRVGDLILAINGIAVERLKMGEVYNLISSKAGKSMRLKLKRGDKIYYKKIILERVI